MASPSPPQDLSERDLRQLYDNEEAERLLHVFSTYVTEVRVPDDATRRKGKYGNTPLESNDTGGTQSDGTERATTVSSLSEAVAMNIIVPLLPPARPNPRPDFTLSRLRLTVQRLYMALEPIYRPFVVDMIHLATWSNRRRSLKNCLAFWILWWFHLLLPSLILRILYSLIRRRIFPYPSYVELQEHRKRVERATEIGEDLSTRLASTTFDLRDLWRLYKHVKPAIRDENQKAKSTSDIPDVNRGSQSSDEDGEHLLDAKSDSDILHVLNSIADFHERVINLFIWRDPVSSRIYGIVIFLLFLLSYIMPAQYLSKLLCFLLGFTFWHVVPIMKALPPSDRARLPVPLASVPTDAEFAMQVISKRVADGDELRPAPASRRSFERSERSMDTHTPSDPQQADIGNRIESDNRIDWSKWGSRFATGKAWVHRTKQQLISTKEIAGRPGPSYSAPERSHSYPAQHRSSTGILTITPDALYFVPASSSKANLEIPLHALRAVKKSDTMTVKGLILRWMDVEPSNGENEERIVWVGGRDELFARLVGRDGGRWLKRVIGARLRTSCASYKYSEFQVIDSPSSRINRMFFTPELLARRDSGFGLLWLAATLGSKSTFKKLPKRSVLTADIAQLCNLIIQPNEPLALRLSSNLMIGAARIYKVKQEMFFSDVNTCAASLRKAVDELVALGEAQLQMAQATFRPGAVTLAPDPKNAFMMEFDMLVADWDEYLDLDRPSIKRALTDEDADYRPRSSKRAKIKDRARPMAEISNVSAHAHTLVEHHDHVLSASFDVSKIDNVGDQMASIDPASTQENFGFADFFPMSDDQCLGDILGDELARELGWESALDGQINKVNLDPVVDDREDVPCPMISNFEDHDHQLSEKALSPSHEHHDVRNPYNDGGFDVANEAFALDSPGVNCMQTDKINFESPAQGSVVSFQGRGEPQPLRPLDDITNKPTAGAARSCAPRQRLKRTRMFLDARTELTDDELKIARAEYIKVQMIQRQENDAKRLEKEYSKLLETRMYGAPLKVTAPALVDFWRASLKAHFEAKTHDAVTQAALERPIKRRKVAEKPRAPSARADTPPPMMQGFDDIDPINDGVADAVGFEAVETGLYRSSEEPGQGRYASRPPSVIGSNLGLNVGLQESFSQSQKTFLFPWDNAGPSSATGAAPFGLSSIDQVFEVQADVHLRGSSRSRRGDSLAPSQIGSNLVGGEFSPAPVGRGSQGLAEDYEFDVKSSARNSVAVERRQTEINVPALERNSLNFLEYTKMQFNTLPNSAQELSFDTIVPKPGSTRHVAAAAFYHCLVLGSKNLLHLKQHEPYGPVSITIEK